MAPLGGGGEAVARILIPGTAILPDEGGGEKGREETIDNT